MKKIIAAGTVAALLAAAPWVMGLIAQGRVNKTLESLSRKAPYIKVVESKWRRGYLSSTHETTFELVLPKFNPAVLVAASEETPMPRQDEEPGAQRIPHAPQESSPIRFSLRDELRHGPLPGDAGLALAVMKTGLVLSEETRKLVEVLGTDRPVQVVTKMGFFGRTKMEVSGKGHDVALADLGGDMGEGTLSWADFNFTLNIAGGAKSYEMEGRQPKIEVRDDKSGAHLLITDLTLKGDGDRLSEDLYDSEAQFRVGKFRFASSGKSVEVEAIEYDYDTDLQGKEFLDYALQMGSGVVRNAELEAEGIDLREVHFDMTMKHLHLDTLQKLVTGIEEANLRTYQGEVDADTAVLEPMQEHGLQLLKHDPELVFDRIGIVTPQGESLVKGSLKLPGVTDADIAAGAAPLLQKLEADFTIEVVEELLGKIPDGAKMVEEAIKAGWLLREGAKLTSHIEFRQGELLVNGKPPQVPQGLPIPGMGPPPPVH